MKNIVVLIALLTAQISIAQIRGNGKLISKSFPIEDLKSVEVHLYADIVIDASQEESLVIQAEENLMDLIAVEISDGKLNLGQIERIEPEIDIQIKIGAPHLEQVIQSTHEKLIVKNIARDHFTATALVGDIQLQGKVNTLRAGAKVGQVDAQQLISDQVDVNIWAWGTVALCSPNKITGLVKENGRVIYEGESVVLDIQKQGDAIVENRDAAKVKKPEARYIDLKVRNHSSQRLNYYVRGPKPDGRYFGYGFSLNPWQTRKKNWTVGTKVYQVNRMGVRKLLLQITAEDEGKVVKL